MTGDEEMLMASELTGKIKEKTQMYLSSYTAHIQLTS